MNASIPIPGETRQEKDPFPEPRCLVCGERIDLSDGGYFTKVSQFQNSSLLGWPARDVYIHLFTCSP